MFFPKLLKCDLQNVQFPFELFEKILLIKCAHLFSGETIDCCCWFLGFWLFSQVLSQQISCVETKLVRKYNLFSLFCCKCILILSVQFTATMEMNVHPGIVSGNWKHLTVWHSQQGKKRQICIRIEYLVCLSSPGLINRRLQSYV